MSDESPLLTFLADRDVACPVCRYNLRGLKRESCPECNAPLRLDVASPSLHLGPFLVVVVSFALGAGFDLVVSLMASVMTLLSAKLAAPATWMGPAFIVGMLGTAGLTCLGMIVLLFQRRAWWNKLGPRRQWIGAGIVFVAVGAGHLGLGVVIGLVI